MNKMLQLVILALVALSVIGIAVGAPANVTSGNAVYIESIKVNGDTYENGDTLKTDLGETLDIRLKIQANQDVDNIEASARLIGYEYNDKDKVSDFSSTLSLQAGDTEYVNLQITVPVRADKDTYELRIDLDGRSQNFGKHAFTVRIAGPRKALLIRDVILTPSGSIESGRSLLAQVRLENIGERDQDDVKVNIAIPALNVEGSVYMNSLDGETTIGRGEKKTSEEVYLRIPACARAGTYELVTTVTFDEFEESTQSQTITITDGGLCSQTQTSNQPQRVIVTAPSAQNVQIGVGGASFPIVIQNQGTASKTFVVSVNGVTDWGAYQISDAAPIVNGGETKVVYVYVTARDGASAGARTFGIDVTVDGQKQSIAAQAILTESTTSMSWKGVLTTLALILLVVVIVLAIIVAVRKMKGGKDDEDEDLDSKGQAYY